MKRTIDSVLLRAERCISDFQLFLEECKDSNFVMDSYRYLDLVLASISVCDIYYKHWMSEFNRNQFDRYRRIRSFDAVRLHSEYVNYCSRPVSTKCDDDLPF